MRIGVRWSYSPRCELRSRSTMYAILFILVFLASLATEAQNSATQRTQHHSSKMAIEVLLSIRDLLAVSWK